MSKPVAIITGAASGIGLALTRHLLAKGWKVAMADINAQQGAAVAAELGDSVLFIPTNVAVYSQQVQLFSRAFAWGGNRLDFFAANAGIAGTSDYYRSNEELDADGLLQELGVTTLRVNLDAVVQGVWLFKHYARRNEGAKGGKVVITSSMAGLYPMESDPLYTATKHALVGFTRATGPVLQRENITVNCFCPAFVVTSLAPKEVLDNFPKEHITPMSTVLRAYDMFLEDPKLSGKVVETSLDQVYFQEPPDFSNESNRWLSTATKELWP
ncbi:uncharacterized protein L3040_009301 [Drepanopeziza brunnea f. sp. 'multigermtubi']|uniref:15-hydroxyprostaglandin dehydrogenase n=1 Tax=Marssonina brunnea f. sp. multigermtubi (strain MB_m1) TaxID=1072389 RepID=K1XEH2_MARBU|nr:uncharacterized protein MBM_02495 [Drepanopeziza brunnea f. sp. 'multigermtubi' MB_m1]EKD19258.1 hypothetical protein MBM_02495 [Drepanopeziza brunnea f. sp. 'multigermtubi' MB_m1]KAJ5032707.1 hypothetical protein L3040_009301 [Drepanopeziza brunnea f. sp. 'multigermtubi']